MKKVLKLTSFVIIILMISVSCSEDILFSETTEEICEEKELASVTNEGFLNFPSCTSFEQFIEDLQNGENPDISYLSRSNNSFKSIAFLNEQIHNAKRTRTEKLSYDDNLEDLEEMTIDEFNLMKAENLIFDNILMHAMDTTLRICIAGELYKITPYGTFSSKKEKVSEIDLAVRNFNPLVKDSIEAGKTIKLNENVNFTNSFKHVYAQEGELLEYEIDDKGTRAPTPEKPNTFHLQYGVDSYKWSNSNIFKAFFDLIRGKDVSKSKEFDKKHRVQVNIFDVNYGFYKSAGVKVRMQQKKKFCCVSYWPDIEAQKLAIGFNQLEGVLKYDIPNNLTIIQPPINAKWSKFQASLNQVTNTFIYGAFHKLKMLRDWNDWVFGWMPEIRIGDNYYREKIINKLYDTAAKEVFDISKALINKHVYQPYEKRIKPTDPMIAYLYWCPSQFTFNEEHPYITGVVEYDNKKSKSVIFDRSFGIAFYGTVPVPYTPSDFKINNIDAFGAAYYNNKWLGIRFYYTK